VTTTAAFVARFLVPKNGQRPEQCEDAVVVTPDAAPADALGGPIVAVLCDGASESLLARDWAQLLAGHLAEQQSGRVPACTSVRRTAAAVVSAAGEWQHWLNDYVERREAARKPLAWYEVPGIERGAYATLLTVVVDFLGQAEPDHDDLTVLAEAVHVSGRGRWRWRAAALGDTCLFHVRDEQLLRKFPIEESSVFGTNPPLAASRNLEESVLARHLMVTDGWCESGDQLYLATDALAAWFLRAVEVGGRPWEILRDFAAAEPVMFETFVAEQRAAGSLRNDDVAFVHIDIG
jgi:hypothetical protein